MKRFFGRIAIALLTMMVCTGCGYHWGAFAHPDVKSISLGDVINETTIFNASYELKQQLSEQFMLDGALKVVSGETADCQVNCSIDSVRFVEVGGGAYSNEDSIYRPRQWQVDVIVNFTVIVPGEKRPLVPTTSVVGSAQFQVRADNENARNNGVRLAMRNAAQKVVSGTTMAW